MEMQLFSKKWKSNKNVNSVMWSDGFEVLKKDKWIMLSC